MNLSLAMGDIGVISALRSSVPTEGDSSGTSATASAIVIDAIWLESINNRIEQLSLGEGRGNPSTIFRVPKSIRDVKPSAYEPQIISFGPYHHGREHLKGMEEHKWSYLTDLLHRDRSKSLEGYLRKMKELEDRARSCYADPIGEKDSNSFVEMMTLDGCFLVEFAIKYSECQSLPQRKEYTAIDRSKFCMIVNDMMLLENQLPFFVLQGIWSFLQCANGEPSDELVMAFLSLLRGFSPTNSSEPSTLPPNLSSPYHLVDLFRSFIVPKRSPEPEPWSPLDIIPCATELEKAGVEFREKAGAYVLEAAFADGVMHMAPLSIYDHTDSYLRNIIAFEQCFPAAGDEASSYAVLMDFLIDTPADVSVLRRSGVLLSGLGSDKEAASFFNNLCKDIFTYRTGKLYVDVREYCKVRHRKWKAELVHDYLRSPWTFIPVMAAAILLLLTLIETIFAALSFVSSLPD